MINTDTFLQEIRTHKHRQGQFVYPDKKSVKKSHNFITVYFLMNDSQTKVLTKLRYKRKNALGVQTWKRMLTQKDKVPKAIDLFLSGYNEKYETEFEFDRIFLVKFS